LSALTNRHTFIKQLRVVIGFSRHQELRERFANECLVGPRKGFRTLFESFPARFIEWRWGSLLDCLKHISPLHAALLLCWDSNVMTSRSKKDTDEARGRGDASSAFEEDDAADEVGKVIGDSCFWSYLHLIFSLAEGVDRLTNWLQSCSCHRSRIVRRACNLLEQVDTSGSVVQDSCPMQGCESVAPRCVF
jgi:hypothetical protein